MTTVLIVDDSRSVRDYLEHLIGSDPELRIIGKVDNGRQALEFLARQRPDVITMDIQMPEMDGFETMRRIMETTPTPIVIISSLWRPGEVARTFQAMEAGAVSILQKPTGIGQPGHSDSREELLTSIKQAAAAKVRRLRGLYRDAPRPAPQVPEAADAPRTIQVVAVGASTGGPPAIQQLLAPLPPSFPAPILIVQHIASGFTSGFVDWLGGTTRLPVRLAEDGLPLYPGQVYVAPEGSHLLLGSRGAAQLSNAPPEHAMRPAVSPLFHSVAQNQGRNGIGVLLTGMGRDGAAELKLIRDAGGITFAQDQATSVIHGMPGEAIRLEACTYILPPQEIAAMLIRLAGATPL